MLCGCFKYDFPAGKFFVYKCPQGRVAAPPCGAFGKAALTALAGELGASPTSRFYRFSWRRKSGKLQSVYHSALLAVIENN